MRDTGHGRRLSPISIMHYIKLVYRSCLLLAALAVYVVSRVRTGSGSLESLTRYPAVLAVIWAVFAVEMVFRFFPSHLESMGCQKQFAKNYRPIPGGGLPEKRERSHGAAGAAGAWFVLNGAIGALYFTHVIDGGILLLISLTYSVCDMVCILFFCPFQTLFMKNKCCTTCRIYNWDYPMMFTPLIFIPGLFTWSLLALALALLIKWETVYHRHPERFYESANQSLACANCREKLCHHKKALRQLWRRQKRAVQEKLPPLPGRQKNTPPHGQKS